MFLHQQEAASNIVQDISVLITSSVNIKICLYILIVEIKRLLFNFVGFEKTVTEMATGCLRMMKSLESWYIGLICILVS